MSRFALYPLETTSAPTPSFSPLSAFTKPADPNLRRELRRFFIRTYGCQMNELDSEVMSGILLRRGLQRVDNEEEADLLVFNTCSIRDLAERKAMGKIGKLSSRKRNNQIIGLTGCMANAKKETLLRKLPAIDFVLGTNNIHHLDSVLDELLHTGQRIVKTESSFYEELDYIGADRKSAVSAYVSIIRGCDKYCTYCVVPYTRGPEVSRSPESILDEVRQLVDRGTREITLLGQNVNSYGKDQPSYGMLFHDLLYEIDKIQGLERLRFMTSHPVDITQELMYAIRHLPSVCEMVHFPLQAGSNRILKKMHRLYSKEDYLEKVAQLKSIVPNVALGTDIIVGFPTETREEFDETLTLMKEIDYHVAFLFSYSQREGTPASRWIDDVPEEEKQRRLQLLLELHDQAQGRHRQAMIGQRVKVLAETVSSRDSQLLQGRTPCWKNILFPGTPGEIGQVIEVEIHSYVHKTLLAHRSLA